MIAGAPAAAPARRTAAAGCAGRSRHAGHRLRHVRRAWPARRRPAAGVDQRRHRGSWRRRRRVRLGHRRRRDGVPAGQGDPGVGQGRRGDGCRPRPGRRGGAQLPHLPRSPCSWRPSRSRARASTATPGTRRAAPAVSTSGSTSGPRRATPCTPPSRARSARSTPRPPTPLAGNGLKIRRPDGTYVFYAHLLQPGAGDRRRRPGRRRPGRRRRRQDRQRRRAPPPLRGPPPRRGGRQPLPHRQSHRRVDRPARAGGCSSTSSSTRPATAGRCCATPTAGRRTRRASPERGSTTTWPVGRSTVTTCSRPGRCSARSPRRRRASSSGTLVANVDNRQPAVLAVAAATLDAIGGRRVLLGIGAGTAPRTKWAAEMDAVGQTVATPLAVPPRPRRRDPRRARRGARRRPRRGHGDVPDRRPAAARDHRAQQRPAGDAGRPACRRHQRGVGPPAARRAVRRRARRPRRPPGFCLTTWTRWDDGLLDPEHPERRAMAARGIARLVLVQLGPVDPAHVAAARPVAGTVA